MSDATTMVLPYNRLKHVGSNKNVTHIDLVATKLLDPVATNKLLATCMLVGSNMFEANLKKYKSKSEHILNFKYRTLYIMSLTAEWSKVSYAEQKVVGSSLVLLQDKFHNFNMNIWFELVGSNKFEPVVANKNVTRIDLVGTKMLETTWS